MGGELTTPTGAAILAATVDAFGAPPPMRVRAIGYGSGTRVLPDRPNLLRVLVGEPLGRAEVAPATSVMVLEANIDDMSPSWWRRCSTHPGGGRARRLVDADLMKKGRPAITVSALAAPPAVADVERAFFRSSTTIGVRRAPADRTVLSRALVEVKTPYGPVRVKVGAAGGEVNRRATGVRGLPPARRRDGVAVREVMSAAAAAGRALLAPVAGKRTKPTRPPPGASKRKRR